MSKFNGYAHSPSTTVRVSISAPEHPELERTIEAPSDAPDAWVANAFLLSIGEDPLPDDDADRFMLPSSYAVSRWSQYGEYGERPTPSPTFTLPGVPHELEADRVQTRRPAVGEPKVAIVDQGESVVDHVSTAPDATHANWQTSAGSLSTREVNTELAAQYGFVQPSFDHSLLNDLGPGVPSGCLLVSLLRALPPVRRLALRAHLRQAGLLVQPVFAEAEIFELFEGLCVLIDRIGHVGIEQSEDGWLPDGVLRDVERMLGWASESQERSASASEAVESPVEALLASARALRLIRRLKGRIILTNLAKDVRAAPTKFAGLLACYAARGTRRPGYDAFIDSGDAHVIVALALLSIADGTAASRADVPGVVARGVTAVKRGMTHYRYDDMGYDYPRHFGGDAPFSDRSIANSITGVLDRLAAAGGAESFREFTPAERRLAHAALL